MFTAPNVILALKIAVSAVTVLLAISIAAIATGRKKLHGRVNTAFFILTLIAVLGFELVIRFVNPQLTADFDPETRRWLNIHLCFSVPSTLLLPVMYATGYQNRRRPHTRLAVVFLILWVGTFVTGVFFLPHTAP